MGWWVTYRPTCGGRYLLISRVIGNLVIYPSGIPNGKLPKSREGAVSSIREEGVRT